MGMSTHIVGFAPPDEKWRKMKAIWDSCEEAGIDVPKEVNDFFGGETPDECGVEIRLQYPFHEAVREWSDDMREGFEIEIAKLPEHCKIVRVYNSY